MDSIGKIVEEMRKYTKYWGEPPDFIVDGWADRIEALMKEHVAEIIAHDTAADVWWQKPVYDIPIGTKLFAAPPASTQDLDDFLSQVQARVIELGHMPPAWPTSERDGTDDPVESAARMICGLLDAAAPAPAEPPKSPPCACVYWDNKRWRHECDCGNGGDRDEVAAWCAMANAAPPAPSMPDEVVKLAREMVEAHYENHREYKVASALLQVIAAPETKEQT